MSKPYVVKRRRSKWAKVHWKSELATILSKEEKRSQWEERRAEKFMVEEALGPQAISLFLDETDTITGDLETLFSLWYEPFEGYTIYSTEWGMCALHGTGQRGCLRMAGKYVRFPDVEQAKRVALYFQARGWKPHQIMDRGMVEGAYVCLNGQGDTSPSKRCQKACRSEC
jgi:hypothetical protein